MLILRTHLSGITRDKMFSMVEIYCNVFKVHICYRSGSRIHFIATGYLNVVNIGSYPGLLMLSLQILLVTSY